MRRIALPFLIGVLFIIFQTTFLTLPPIQRIRPDVILILTLYLGLTYPPISGGILVFFIGYLMDLFSGNLFGLYTFSRLLIFYITQFFKARLYLGAFLSQCLFVLIFSLFEGIVILILLTALNPNPDGKLVQLLFTFLLPQSFFTGLISPVVFSFLDKGFSLLIPSPWNRKKREETRS